MKPCGLAGPGPPGVGARLVVAGAEPGALRPKLRHEDSARPAFPRFLFRGSSVLPIFLSIDLDLDPALLRVFVCFVVAQKRKRRHKGAFLGDGGADGTRTRDPRRDRPVF